MHFELPRRLGDIGNVAQHASPTHINHTITSPVLGLESEPGKELPVPQPKSELPWADSGLQVKHACFTNTSCQSKPV